MTDEQPGTPRTASESQIELGRPHFTHFMNPAFATMIHQEEATPQLAPNFTIGTSNPAERGRARRRRGDMVMFDGHSNLKR